MEKIAAYIVVIGAILLAPILYPSYGDSDTRKASERIQSLLESQSAEEMLKSAEELYKIGGLYSTKVRGVLLAHLRRLKSRTVEQWKMVVCITNMVACYSDRWMRLLTIETASVIFETLHIFPPDSDVIGLMQGPVSALIFGYPLFLVRMDGGKPIDFLTLLVDYAQLWWMSVTDECDPSTPLFMVKCREKRPTSRFPSIKSDTESVRMMRKYGKYGWGGNLVLDFGVREEEKELLKRMRSIWNGYYSNWKIVRGFPVMEFRSMKHPFPRFIRAER